MISRLDGARYGLMGLPLAFVALPLYVQLPTYYASEFGVSLAALGAVLLATRLFDAVLDPFIGRWADRLLARRGLTLATFIAAASLLAAGFALLVLPQVRGNDSLLAWAALSLAATYAAFSVVTVLHQAWGASLGGDEAQRSAIAGWREGLGLLGVLIASALPALLGWGATAVVLALALSVAIAALAFAPWPQRPVAMQARTTGQSPFGQPRFWRLLAVFMLNGTAAAIPATLLLPFMQDRLQLAAHWQPLLLVTYFICAAGAVPIWLKLVPRLGLARTWLAGMALSVASFAWAAVLGPGDGIAFAVVCAFSGVALATDLALPAALLAGVIGAAGHRGAREGAYFGWWNFAAKLNLALAAGIALPLLSLAGYSPGSRSQQALSALALTYCLLPCVLKVAAAGALHFLLIRPGEPP